VVIQKAIRKWVSTPIYLVRGHCCAYNGEETSDREPLNITCRRPVVNKAQGVK
jgi:hypothetical protein